MIAGINPNEALTDLTLSDLSFSILIIFLSVLMFIVSYGFIPAQDAKNVKHAKSVTIEYLFNKINSLSPLLQLRHL